MRAQIEGTRPPAAQRGASLTGDVRKPRGSRGHPAGGRRRHLQHSGAGAACAVTEQVTHTGALWRWTTPSAPGAWHFVTIDGAAGEALSATALMRRLEKSLGGFGSLKVTARIGDSSFATSVFPSKEQGWLLPVKAAVRKAEGLADGDMIELSLEY